MAFPPSFLDELRARVSLPALIGRRVRLTKRGKEHTGLCPFHSEKSPSFTVNDDKGFFHCFGCGAHGDAIGFVMRADSLSFPEAVERLAGEAGLEVPRASPEEAQRFKAQATLRDATEVACQWFESRLRAPEGRVALDYLRRRGLDDATIARFRLGYAPESGDALKRAAAAKDITEDQLLEAGLLKRPDDGRPPFAFFRDRVMFPIADRGGRIIAFGARALGDAQPKYLNSPDTPLFDKGRTLYAYSLARAVAAERNEIIACEGYMDVIALHQAGFANAVAPLGTALTEFQLDQLWKAAPEPILCFDADSAGKRAAARTAERALPLVGPGRSVRIATIEAGKDPDELIRAQGPQAMRDVLDKAKPLVDFLWSLETEASQPRTPEQWAALQQALEQRAARIEHRETRTIYRDQLLGRYRRWLRETDRAAWQALARRPGQGGARSAPRPWQPGRKFTPPMPGEHLRVPSGETARSPAMDLADKRWRILLAAMVNHPGIVDDFSERLALLNPPNAGLDRLLAELHTPRSHGLDSGGLRSHLMDNGFRDVLDSILTPDVYKLAYDVQPSAEPEAVRRLCLHTIEKLEAEQLEAEYFALREAVQAAPGDEALALRFVQIAESRNRHREQLHRLDDMDDASWQLTGTQ
ncbi:MAG: DNA primase [Rhodospirillales bacterium]|nr:DNA primase [Rhodospirillales bacterium]